MVALAVASAALLLLLVATVYGRSWYRPLALVAFGGHLLVSLVLLPRLPYTWDIVGFHRAALELAAGAPVTASKTVSSFAAFQGLLYTVFGAQPATLSVFNGLLAVLVPLPVAYLADSLYPSTEETLAVGLAALFLPLPFLFLSIPMRDTLAVLLALSLLAVVVRALRRGSPMWGLPALPLWGMLYMLRAELSLIVVLGVLTVGTVSGIERLSPSLSAVQFTAILGTVGAVGFALFAELLYPFQVVNAQLRGRARGGAVYLDGMSYSSWTDFLVAAPARGIYFQFAPFPLHVESVFHLLAFGGTLVAMVLLVSGARSLAVREYDERVAVLLGVVYIAGVVGYGTINSNFGTNVRHRMVFDFLLVVFAAPVLHRWWLRLRAWVGVAPGQGGDGREKQREAQELHGGVHRGRQNANEANR
ncbi:hypothetical protein [Haloarcula laminariae]|uniref:hypothetical protein n=1 Tax=Haloarcula laminariae TaxID=2961577 RepID=UPI0024060F6A|nr:hypothetical protein [Halomicroarcula sp. FL173]